MRYRKIGDTGVETSILGCGGFRFPTVGGDEGKIDRRESGAGFSYAFDHGVNFVDSSYVYQNGDSERFIGEFQSAHGVRSKMIISTKLPTWLVNEANDPNRILNEQLLRLRTDFIDFYLLHMLTIERWDRLKQLGIIDFFRRALSDGRIRHVGFSSHEVNSLPIFKDYCDFKLVLKQYNYLDRNLQGAEDLIAAADTHGYGIAVMEPLRGGMLGDMMPPAWKGILKKIEINGSPAAKGLFWVLSKKGVAVTLSNMARTEYAIENIATANMLDTQEMTDDLARQYDRVTDDIRKRQVVRCTACRYCEPHCPNGIPIAYNLELLNFLATELGMYKRAELLRVNAASTPGLGNHFSLVRNAMDLGEGEHAADCTSCRACEQYCPQQIRIADELATFAYIVRTDQLPGEKNGLRYRMADIIADNVKRVLRPNSRMFQLLKKSAGHYLQRRGK